jgi:two-component system, OmpR family, sensor histidine kinase SenX3
VEAMEQLNAQHKGHIAWLWLVLLFSCVTYLAFTVYEYHQNSKLLAQNHRLTQDMIQSQVGQKIDHELTQLPASHYELVARWYEGLLPITWQLNQKWVYPFYHANPAHQGNQAAESAVVTTASCENYFRKASDDQSIIHTGNSSSQRADSEVSTERSKLVVEVIDAIKSLDSNRLKLALQNLIWHKQHFKLDLSTELMSLNCIFEADINRRLSFEVASKLLLEGFRSEQLSVPSLSLLIFNHLSLMNSEQATYWLARLLNIAEYYNLPTDVLEDYRLASIHMPSLNLAAKENGIYVNESGDIVWQRKANETIVLSKLFHQALHSAVTKLKHAGFLEQRTEIVVDYHQAANELNLLSDLELTIIQPKWQQKKKVDAIYMIFKVLFILFFAWVVYAYLRNQSQKIRQTEQYLELKEDFVNSVSHELKTPLASLKLMSEMLVLRLEKSLPIKDYPQRIQAEVKTLEDMVEQILQLNRIRSGLESFNPQPINLRHIIETECHRAKESSVLSYDVNVDSAVMIAGNATLLGLLFRNLISNTVKYCDKEQPQITFKAEALKEQIVKITLIDNAKGIDSIEPERVFQPFYRESAMIAGAGIGLSLCRAIVEIHDGIITIESTSAAGTKWVLVLKTALENEHHSEIK